MKMPLPSACLCCLLIALPSLGAAEKADAPAEFQILPEVVAENPGAYTATMDTGPVNTWVSGGSFEPMFFRTLIFAQADSPDELITDYYGDRYQSGHWDGADVRVYRIHDGKLAKVREDKVKRHTMSGWHWDGSENIQGVIKPDATAVITWQPGWSRRDADYYYCVRARNQEGKASVPSNWVKVHIGEDYPKKIDPVENPTVKIDWPKEPKESEAPPAPTGFKADYDQATGHIKLSWNAVQASDLAGYEIGCSDCNPDQHEGFHIYLADSPTDPARQIKKGDMVFLAKEFRDWDKRTHYGNRIYNSHEGPLPPLITFNVDDTKSWAFVPHPEPIPAEFAERGQTCLFLDIKDDEKIVVDQYNHASTTQAWYQVLDPAKTYVVEFWAKADMLAGDTLTFDLPGPYGHPNLGEKKFQPIAFTIGKEWKQYRAEWKVALMLTTDTSVGKMALSFQGPAKLWLDNFRVYEKGTDYLDFPAADYQELKDSGMAFIRTHSHIKSFDGYSMESFTNARGAFGHKGTGHSPQQTLSDLLRVMEKGGVSPWLQVEMCMSEDEWLGFVEYYCAPYDPAKDTPASKPWAYKRFSQGHPQPYVETFPRTLFEISNETWNPMFRPWCFNWVTMADEADGKTYGSGQIYGMFQEYVIQIMKKSPYWTPKVDKKFEFVIGGWAINRNEYGRQAMDFSPSSRYCTVAAYNGGWESGEQPQSGDDNGLLGALQQPVQEKLPLAIELEQARREAAARGVNYVNGTYEAGPGYALPNTIGKEQVEMESLTMKSLAAGTATLDCFLMNGLYGFKVQNFFTFSRGRNFWTSHAREVNGGAAYPSWKALSMYNRHGLGDFLLVKTIGVPTMDIPRTPRRQPVKDAPLVGAYATRSGDDYHVFLLSRKLDNCPVKGDDGFTPVTLDLPFDAPQAIELYTMEGDPRAHNLDADVVKVQKTDVPPAAFNRKFVLSEKTGAKAKGLPPAATYLYVFKGVKTFPVDKLEASILPAPGTLNPADNPDIQFLVQFNKPVKELKAEALKVGGTAGASSVLVAPQRGSFDTAFIVGVGGLTGNGTVTLGLTADAVESQDGKFKNGVAAGEIVFKMTEGKGLRLLAWDFPDKDSNLTGKTIPATYVMPIVQPAELKDSPKLPFNDNIHYNLDGTGSWAFNGLEPNPESYYSFIVAPAPGKAVALSSVMVGLFSLHKTEPLKAALRYSLDGFASFKEVPLVSERPVMNCFLAPGQGIPATAALDGDPALQNLSTPVEFRIHLYGYQENNVAGIGKLGYNGEGDDIVVEGMIK